MFRKWIPLAFLAACAAPVVELEQSVPVGAQDTCQASPYAGLIGQDATALERVLILRQVRVIRPGMAVTMDFRSERINFDIDNGNRIARIWCG